MLTERMAEVVERDLAEIVAATLPWERLAGQRIAIAGAGGFVGSYLVRTLLTLHKAGRVDSPVEVDAMVRNTRRGRDRFTDLADDPHFRLLEWNLSAVDVPDLSGVNYVVHCASQASPRFYDRDPVGTLLPNSVGTAALLSGLQAGGDPRGFLFVSSGDVYGHVEDRQCVAEDDYGTLNPATVRSCYSESKRMGETIAVSWHHQYGLPCFIGRLGHTYGPGLQSDDGRVFADFAYNVARGENIVMMSDGLARRPFCYITDAVIGLFSVLLLGEPAVPYNVSNPAGELSVRELANLLVDMYPEKALSIEQRRQSDPRYVKSPFSRTILDVARLEGLGWRASIDPATGFRRMIQALS